jgi:hypothetical protein
LNLGLKGRDIILLIQAVERWGFSFPLADALKNRNMLEAAWLMKKF